MGGVVSTTHTWKVQLLLLPEASLAMQVTGVHPRGNSEPEGGVQVTGRGPSQASVALTV